MYTVMTAQKAKFGYKTNRNNSRNSRQPPMLLFIIYNIKTMNNRAVYAMLQSIKKI